MSYRPPTGQRLAGSGLARPPTGGGRPGTGTRGVIPGRPGSGIRGQGARLTTAAGIGATVGGGIGGGAVIPEKNIYSVQIRNKMNEIQKEIDRLNDDMIARQDDGIRLQQLRKQLQDQGIQIKELYQDLQDMNAVNELAEQRVYLGGLSEQDVDNELNKKQEETSVLASKNERMRNEVDKIFTRKEEVLDEIKRSEDEIERRQEEFEQIVSQLTPQEQEGYHAMLEEKERLELEKSDLQAQIDSAMQRLKKMEDEVGADPRRKRGMALRQKLERLQRRSQELDDELGMGGGISESDPSVLELAILPGDDKETVKRKMREGNVKTKEYEELTQQEEKAMADLRKELLKVGMDEMKKEDEEKLRSDLQKLVEKEREVDDWMASFNTARKEEEDKKVAHQETIVNLLLHISKGLKHSNALFTTDEVAQTQDDLEFKRGQAESAINTREQLKQDLAKRKADLEQMKTMEQTLTNELESLAQSTKTAQEEIKLYSNLDALREKFKISGEELAREEQHLSRRMERMRETAEAVSAEVDEMKERAKVDKPILQLETLEKRVKAHYRQIYELQHSLTIAERESSTTKMHDECNTAVKEINAMHITIATQSPTSITTSAAISSSSDQVSM
ncbi:putative Intraflagellar Transport Protein 72 [Monocercomonoides exilis]|uniref:putative Intraflagellar Transport Protein 72 n=1 Tax=Monocercomonoides exilis TaxID=2049356 RepID=UPI00355AC9E0|nr:putative Intraflagellar Transport Protein 72 [Monocercomonoides exilis]|eukprot:MONOS_6459.1-p1 / transcript=MONOS_6459.1 / gene=MONOS_6459 / organism=Monocercomonoides_exilis_PA203 / gene_product=Intraflagellar Transport Protein 72 / transcript_product=Intraflagellar Transport Protein 72 / location=Mono_scaffold00203:58324-60849(-) / protein_length=621 / sequence_SO=supercontig / SO=protein_coding / is_pseudo=false